MSIAPAMAPPARIAKVAAFRRMNRSLRVVLHDTQSAERVSTKAVFFDVDFTLIHPGPTFRGEGYRAFCARYGMDVDASKFADAVGRRGAVLDEPEGRATTAEIFVDYTGGIIEGMGGTGPHLDACAREMYVNGRAASTSSSTTRSPACCGRWPAPACASA
jgi:hypothetical protein